MAAGTMRTAIVSMATALVLTAPCLGATDTAAGPSDLDEVLVRAQRVQLQEMRKEMVRLEDQFYARYDELNTNDDFDIHCFKEARTGTRIIKRTCRAAYEDEALQEEGQAALAIRQYVQPGLQSYKFAFLPDPKMLVGGTPAPPMMTILAHLDEFRANMKDVVSRDPQLLDLLRERAELIRRYEAARRRIFKRHPTAGDAATNEADQP